MTHLSPHDDVQEDPVQSEQFLRDYQLREQALDRRLVREVEQRRYPTRPAQGTHRVRLPHLPHLPRTR